MGFVLVPFTGNFEDVSFIDGGTLGKKKVLERYS